MTLIAFDLDDTLMKCGKDYIKAKETFAEFISTNYPITFDHALETFEEIDQKSVEKYGLSMERFPKSMVKSYNELVSNPLVKEEEHVRGVGYTVFKSANEYSNRGFMSGAKEVLTRLNEMGFELHLITAGDKRVQQKKVDGLNLDNFFNETHITEMGGKPECLGRLIENSQFDSDEVFLVGNSMRSDIKSALEVDANGVYIPAHEWRATEETQKFEQRDDVYMFEDMNELHQNLGIFEQEKRLQNH